MLLDDDREYLYQYDTGRAVIVEPGIDTVHFSDVPYGKSYVVGVSEQKANIPDELLQASGSLICWAFVGTADQGYTKHERVFKVIKRAKPSDYVFTPTEQKTIDELYDHMEETVEYRLSKAKESGEFDGVSVVDAEVNAAGELILYYSDGESDNVGVVKGEKGDTPDISFKRDIVSPEKVGGKTRLYAAIPGSTSNPDGNQGYVVATTSSFDKYGAVLRSDGGSIIVPDVPRKLDHATSKRYVDTSLEILKPTRLWFHYTMYNKDSELYPRKFRCYGYIDLPRITAMVNDGSFRLRDTYVAQMLQSRQVSNQAVYTFNLVSADVSANAQGWQQDFGSFYFEYSVSEETTEHYNFRKWTSDAAIVSMEEMLESIHSDDYGEPDELKICWEHSGIG